MGTESIITLIAVFLLFLYVILDALNAFAKHTRFNPIPFILMSIGVLFLILILYRGTELVARDWAQILLTIGLLTITAVYAWSTQKMAKEMEEQRIISSRPYLIQKAVHKKDIYEGSTSDEFLHFEIYNAGNGPAIEVEVCLLLQRKPPYQPHNGQREGFLRAGDTPIKFHTTFPPEIGNSTFYIVSEYQGISSYGSQPTWYQTWLPCKLSVSGKVISGKLEFREVSEEKRISIFSSEFNNKDGEK